ncbi:unnamed protein product, partial [Adineta steineri]
GRFTLSVDCFMPNIERIVKAVQIQNVQNRVVLVQNALYAKSGELLRLTNESASGLQLTNNTQMDVDSHYNVKTIRFDDLLPILVERKVRAAVIKIDIEGSESYMCETGSKVFEVIDIQLVMMEWGHGFRKWYKSRYQSIIKFFALLDYVVTDENLQLYRLNKLQENIYEQLTNHFDAEQWNKVDLSIDIRYHLLELFVKKKEIKLKDKQNKINPLEDVCLKQKFEIQRLKSEVESNLQ